ncbi:hypothetical protein E3Q13_03424 [Wallemia mellicola]|nr:hypothetical protein E3Q13_03424 [Wallemia mellicola]
MSVVSLNPRMRISEIRIKHSIKDLKAYDKIALRKFDSKDAWFISDKLRSYDYEGADIVFAIRLFNGLELASGVIGQVAPHNYDWLNAKLNTVAKYHMSSYLYGQTLVTKHHSLPDYALSSSDTSRIVQITDSFESVKEYFRTVLIEDKGSTISWHELHSKQREFARTVSGKTVEITSDAVERFFKSIFPNSETKEDGKRGLYIRNLRLKESHEKVNISATKVMDEKTENKFPNYAADGGAFPINVRGISGPIGAITISGLPKNLVDHALAYKVISELSAHQSKNN